MKRRKAGLGARLVTGFLRAVPLGLLGVATAAMAQSFHLPTLNRALFDPGQEEAFFTPTPGKPWVSGTFGCVRSEGQRFHEGLDIRCLERDTRGEPTDAVMAASDGRVAYVNNRPGLSNYGNYIILRHGVDGVEIYSLYAHLRDIRADLRPGQPVQAGERIGVMGRTANIRPPISKDRAHLHFELALLLNDRYGAWYRQTHRGQRNDHGDWNGQALVGLDPQSMFLAQQRDGAHFNVLRFIRNQVELCRVTVRDTDFPWLYRYPGLVYPNAVAEREGVAGYEIALTFAGVPFELVPRAATELKGRGKFELLSVNEAEYARGSCRRLVTRVGSSWRLGRPGEELLELLTF